MFGPIFISAVVFWALALGGGLYWARRYVRAIELRSSLDERIAELERRLRTLEASVSESSVLPRAEPPPAVAQLPSEARRLPGG